MDYLKIGSFLQELRKSNGLTQADIAERFDISSKTVSKWECGNSLPEIPILKGLADFYNVTVDEILNGCKKENKEEIQKEDKKDYFDYKKKKLDLWMMLSFITLLFGLLILFIIGYSTNIASAACFTSISIYFASLTLFFVGIYLLGDINKNLTIEQQVVIKDRRYLNYSLYIVSLIYFTCLSIIFYAIPKSVTDIIPAVLTIETFLQYILIGFVLFFIIFSLIINFKSFRNKLNRIINIILEVLFILIYCFVITGMFVNPFIDGTLTIGISSIDFEYYLTDYGFLGYLTLIISIISVIVEIILLVKNNKFIVLSKVGNLIGFIGILLIYVNVSHNKENYMLEYYESIIHTTNFHTSFSNTDNIFSTLSFVIACLIPTHIIYDLITIIRKKKSQG